MRNFIILFVIITSLLFSEMVFPSCAVKSSLEGSAKSVSVIYAGTIKKMMTAQIANVSYSVKKPKGKIYAENQARQRSFFIETQPDSPLLIRNLSATILPINSRRTMLEMEVTFYIENRSKKKIARYSYQDPAEDESNYDDDPNYGDFNERGTGTNLLPGQSHQQTLSMTVDGKSLVYRINSVKFEDGTMWKAAPYNPAKSNKSARFTASAENSNNSQPEGSVTKRIVAREGWTSPIFADRVTKIINGTPQVIEGVKVNTKLHELKTERLNLVETCDINLDNLEIAHNSLDFDVEQFTTYEINGKVFAYQVPYEFIDTEEEYDIGAGTIFIYVDEEGNGQFKLRCDETELRKLPAWIKTQTTK